MYLLEPLDLWGAIASKPRKPLAIILPTKPNPINNQILRLAATVTKLSLHRTALPSLLHFDAIPILGNFHYLVDVCALWFGQLEAILEIDQGIFGAVLDKLFVDELFYLFNGQVVLVRLGFWTGGLFFV